MVLYAFELMAHSHFTVHCEDMMEVFGFEENRKLFSRTSPQYNKSWMKFISSDMIDNTEFHKKLERLHPNLNISHPRYHRLLFHWPYSAKPWTRELERYIRTYCHINKLDEELTIGIFKKEIQEEQNRRNNKIMEETEKVFGFAHGRKKERGYTNFFAGMAYNVHLLGDQQTDNSEFRGVVDMNILIGQIIITLRYLDNVRCKPLEKEITKINKKYTDPHKKADALMLYLKQSVPSFIKEANGGSVYRRLENRGIKFKKQKSFWDRLIDYLF